MTKLLALSLVILSSVAHAQVRDLSHLKFVDPSTIFMSPEYTFQDQTMVDEPGRLTMKTPHKLDKVEKMATYLLQSRGLDFSQQSSSNLYAFKAGHYIEMSPGEKWYVNSEPVCIEVNHTPRNIYEVDKQAPAIFAASERAGLVPYINPAAERSGMGHVHVGAATLGENPFFKNPKLLRNLMVYEHQHPSLLWGFAEAYDVGSNSNIESLHNHREEAFEKAIAEFDAWWAKAKPKERADGFAKYLAILFRHGGHDFFQHYRAINLEHLLQFAWGAEAKPELTGKLTVELRNLRPPKRTTLTAELEMLLQLFDHLADPKRDIPFKKISAQEYERFFAASKVAADWQLVRREIGLNDARVDGMINEYVDAVHRYEYSIKGIKGARVFAAFSRKDDKGTKFEILIPASESDGKLQIEGKDVPLELIRIGRKNYFVGLIETQGSDAVTNAESIKLGRLSGHLTLVRPTCDSLFSRAM